MSHTIANTLADIPLTILGGYLGAGKTTLLNRLLHDNQGLRIALLINDFGAINIDAGLIDRQTDQQINLTNGCVCCGLSDGFDEALSGLLESAIAYDHIIVEASGVANVHNLAQYGKTPGLQLDAVVVVADATSVLARSRDKYVANTVKRQLQAADLLLLNKVDLASDAQRSQLRNWLTELTGGVPVVETSFCKLPQALLLGGNSSRHSGVDKALNTSTLDNLHDHEEADHQAIYVTWNFTSNQVLDRSQAEAMLAEFPADLLRGKGFIRMTEGTLEWHRVGRQERLTAARVESNTRLVAIGLRGQLDTDALTALARRYISLYQLSLNS